VTTVLITGAGGYIGSVLTAHLLDAGHSVIAIDRFFFGRDTLPQAHPCLRTIRQDTRNIQSGTLGEVDAIIDLAALSNDPSGELDPDKTWEINYAARARLARIAKEMGVNRYVLPSSCSVYGFQEGVLDESSKPNPLTTYAEANLAAERAVLALADPDFCVVVLRQATVYGASPRMRFDLAINGMVKGLFLSGTVPILRDGKQWRPFVHIRDVARALELVLCAPRDVVNGEVINIGSDDQNVQILPLAEMIAAACNQPFRLEWYGLPDHRSYRVSFEKANDLLHFRAQLRPADAAREMYDLLAQGALNPNDPKTITVNWYKHLLESQRIVHEVELEGRLL
jgi:nucleoside-diphosphate-sugar epimerase